MPVVTIGRLLGSRGDEIGRALAERLNYRYLDHRLLLDYVREFGEVEANALFNELDPTPEEAGWTKRS